MIPVYKPFLTKKSLEYAHKALNSGWISSHGKYIEIVKDKLQDLLNVKHVLLTNNGTSATHLVAKCLKYKYPNIQNIIVPNNVFVAAINSFLFDKEFKLYANDASLETWNMSFENLQDPEAILVIHNIGNIINIENIKNMYPNAVIVEDNCEGFLGKYDKKKYSGSLSLASSISFYGNKNLTSGEGGAFITNDADIFEYARCIHGQGYSDTKFLHKELGYNYRITNIQAAILLGQLEIMPDIMKKKNDLFQCYFNHFSKIHNVKLQKIDFETEPANWMFGVRVIGGNFQIAKSIFEKNKIEIRPIFYPIDMHSHLEKNSSIVFNYDKKLNNAKLLNNECIILPSYPDLKKDEIKHIFKTFKEYISVIKG